MCLNETTSGVRTGGVRSVIRAARSRVFVDVSNPAAPRLRGARWLTR
jgi:phosphoserine aminotransferase